MSHALILLLPTLFYPNKWTKILWTLALPKSQQGPKCINCNLQTMLTSHESHEFKMLISSFFRTVGDGGIKIEIREWKTEHFWKVSIYSTASDYGTPMWKLKRHRRLQSQKTLIMKLMGGWASFGTCLVPIISLSLYSFIHHTLR